MSQEKYIGMDVRQATIRLPLWMVVASWLSSASWRPKRLHSGTAQNPVGELRGGNLCGLATRSAKVSRQPSCSLRPAKERTVEGWQQEWPDRSASWRSYCAATSSGLSTTNTMGHELEGVGSKLSNHTKDLTEWWAGSRRSTLFGRSLALAPRFMLAGIATNGCQDFASSGFVCSGSDRNSHGKWRAERVYQELDLLRPLHQQACCDLVEDSRRHPSEKLLRQIPSIGPIAALCWWPCCKHHIVSAPTDSGGPTTDCRRNSRQRRVPLCPWELLRNRERISVRGLSDNYNRDLKNLFKSTPISALNCAIWSGNPLQLKYALIAPIAELQPVAFSPSSR